jgi:hypothetical protein
MAIDPAITASLQSLQLQVQAAEPLSQTDHATLTAIKLNAANLVNAIQAALVAPSLLDSWVAPADAPSIATGLLSVSTAADDARNLALMRGVVGRATSNINQVPS